MKICSACSAENNSDSKFCSACGGVLVPGPEATVDHNPPKNETGISLQPMMKFDRPPEKREYVHATCGEKTPVDGNDFRALCDPRFAVDRTFCSHCQQFDSLDAFHWSDTKETLTAYRSRLRALVPPLVRVAGSKWLFGVWILLAAVTGFGLSKFIASFDIAYGIAAVIYFAIAMACDGIGKMSTQNISFHQYQ